MLEFDIRADDVLSTVKQTMPFLSFFIISSQVSHRPQAPFQTC